MAGSLRLAMGEGRACVRQALPILASLVGSQAMEIIDALMVGRLGAEALAAAGLSGGITGLLLVTATGFASSLSVLSARTHGASDDAASGRLAHCAFWAAGGLGALLLAIIALSYATLDSMGQEAEVVALARPYLFWVGLSVLPGAYFRCFKQFSDGAGRSVHATTAHLSGLALNIVLNWLFIYELGWGLTGAGIATFTARTTLAVGYHLWLARAQAFRHLNYPLLPPLPEWATLRRLLSLGLPACLQYLFEVGVFSATTVMAGWVSAEALAAHQIVLRIASLTFMIPLALSFAASIRVGAALGAQNHDAAQTAGYGALLIGAFATAGIALVLGLGRTHLPLLFIDDPAVTTMAAGALFVAALFQIFDGAQAIAVGVLRGFLDTRIPVFVTFCAYWVIACPAAYYFAFVLGAGINGLWYGLMLGLASSAAALNVRFFRLGAGRRSTNRRPASALPR